jgi:hypothetical protein
LPRSQYKKPIHNLHALGLAPESADVNFFRNGISAPPLVMTSINGTPALVKALLTRGAKVNARDKQGRTALHYAAARHRHRDNHIVRLLIAAGADVNAKDHAGVTPLMLAQGSRNIRALVNRRPKMSIREEIETTLKPFLGERLSGMWRAGFQIFEIGEQRPCKNRKGEDITLADMNLHVSCNWYVTRNGVPIVSSEDFGPEWGERRDENAMPFYALLGEPDFIITSIQAKNNGGVVIQMAGGYTLQIVTEEEAEVYDPDEEAAEWRFLPKDENLHHLVVSSEGIERY